MPEFIDLFYNKGLRASDVAFYFGVAVSSIGDFRSRHNLPPRGVIIPIPRPMADTHPFRNGFHKGKSPHNKKLPDFFICKECECSFKNITGHKRVFCSRECYKQNKKKTLSPTAFKPKEKHRFWIKDRTLVTYQKSFTVRERKEIYERDKCCVKCGIGGTLSRNGLQVDHVIAICMGGENVISNGQILCRECHRIKTANDIKTKNKLLDMRMKLSDFIENNNRAALTYG